MRILLLTHYYAPELGAPQTRLGETAAELRHSGHHVRVVTGPPHYPDGVVRTGYSAARPSRESIDGIQVTRLPMIPRRNGGFLDRTVDQASFAAAALAAAPDARWADVLVVESPPLFLGGTAAILRRLTGRPYLFHVADPWPDFPIAMGALTNSLAQRIAYALENVAYRSASLVTTVTPGLVALLAAKPAAGGKVRLLPNAVDTRRFDPAADRGLARARSGWTEPGLHLVYAGSVGRAQGLGTLLDAVTSLRGHGLVVHVVGEGFERARLEAEAGDRGLGHVRFEAAVPSQRIPGLLAAADAILVMLRAGPLYEHSLPTKLLEGLAAGRPIVVSAAGEAARLVADAGAGITAIPEDGAALRGAIEQLVTMSDTARFEMGSRARLLAEGTYDRRSVVRRLVGYLTEVAAPTSGASGTRQ